MSHFGEERYRHSYSRRQGLVTAEWILLFTLLAIGAFAGIAALDYSILRQQDALGLSVEGMNFPAVAPLPTAISSSASTSADPNR